MEKRCLDVALDLDLGSQPGGSVGGTDDMDLDRVLGVPPDLGL